MGRRVSIEAREAFLLARRAATASAVLIPRTGAENWYINAQAGSDANSGLSPTQPLQSWARYIQLTGYEENFDNRSVDVFCSGTFPDSDPIIKRARTTGAGNAHWGLHGVHTVLLDTNMVGAFQSSVQAAGGGTRASFTVPAGLTVQMDGALVYFPDQGAWSQITTVVGQTATCLDASAFGSAGQPLDCPLVAIPPGARVQILTGTSGHLALDLITPPFSTKAQQAINGATPLKTGPFLVEKIAARDTALVRSVGSLSGLAAIQACQFNDVDFECSAVYFRKCSIKTQQASFVRGLFDGTTGPSFEGCAFGTTNDTRAFAATCNMSGFEFGQFFGGGANEIGDDCSYAFSDFWVARGIFGIWTTSRGSFTGVDGRGSLVNPFGVCANSYAITAAGIILYSGSIYATGSLGQFRFRKSGTNAWGPPPIAGGPMPAQAPCTTMTQLSAAPFNGAAFDYNYGGTVGIAPA